MSHNHTTTPYDIVPSTGYYGRGEVSNSDLTALKELLHPRPVLGDRDAAFRFGRLVDAMVTEPATVDRYLRTAAGVEYSAGEWARAERTLFALRNRARRDTFLAKVLDVATTQTAMTRTRQLSYCDFTFTLPTRCKWDWWLGTFGGDLKTTSAATPQEFDNAIDIFDWDRSRAFYMDIAGSDCDFIYAVSKSAPGRVFSKMITRDDALYRRGRDKYLELAFQFWSLTPFDTNHDNQ